MGASSNHDLLSPTLKEAVWRDVEIKHQDRVGAATSKELYMEKIFQHNEDTTVDIDADVQWEHAAQQPVPIKPYPKLYEQQQVRLHMQSTLPIGRYRRGCLLDYARSSKLSKR